MLVRERRSSGADGGAEERRLLEAARADPSRYAEVYRANVAAVHAFVMSRTRDRQVAEEVTAEVFVRAIRALPRFEWRGVPYSSYLVRIADRLLSDRWAREGRPPPTIDAAAEPDPFAAVDGATAVDAALAALPVDQQAVLRLRFVEDMAVADVAAALGRSDGAVKQLQHRALRTLRARLESEDGR